MLLFKKKFIELIKKGEKTQTIRLWRHCQLRPGQRSYIPGIGYIAILSVEPVEINALTDADAKPDGFSSAKLLRKELQKIYASEIKRGHKAYRVCFSVYPPEVQQSMREEKAQKKAAMKQAEYKQRMQDADDHVKRTLVKLKQIAET